MSKPGIEEVLAPKPEAHPRIYADSIADAAHKGLLKVGQTTRDVKRRIAEQPKTAAIENYTIELNESAEREDGSIFSDHEVRAALQKKPDLFLAVTGLTVQDFHLLVSLRVFNTEQMNQAVFAFRRYEDASLRYTGIESHEGLSHYGLYDTVVAKD